MVGLDNVPGDGEAHDFQKTGVEVGPASAGQALRDRLLHVAHALRLEPEQLARVAQAKRLGQSRSSRCAFLAEAPLGGFEALAGAILAAHRAAQRRWCPDVLDQDGVLRHSVRIVKDVAATREGLADVPARFDEASAPAVTALDGRDSDEPSIVVPLESGLELNA